MLEGWGDAATPKIEAKEVLVMAIRGKPEYYGHIVEASKDAFLTMLNDPACWSEEICIKTLQRLGLPI
jgi:hypothetical protein